MILEIQTDVKITILFNSYCSTEHEFEIIIIILIGFPSSQRHAV